MAAFEYKLTINCQTQEQADRVVQERLGYEEDYGFEYTLDASQEA